MQCHGFDSDKGRKAIMGKNTGSLKKVAIGLVLTVLGFTNVSCSSLGAMITGTDSEQVGTFGAHSITDEAPFEKIDLARELYPGAEEGVKEENGLYKNQQILREAFQKFYENPIDQKKRRNRLQERMLAASEQRCGVYTKYLKSLDSRTNFFLGSITTAVAGAGAIVTGASAARALAGVAGIFSGVRAEFNEDYFASLTIQVITDGYHSKRRATYKNIRRKQSKSISSYPVEAAIRDAIQFNNECSLNSGLEHAGLALKRAENPGIRGAKKAILQAKELQFINNVTSPEELAQLEFLLPSDIDDFGFSSKDILLGDDIFDSRSPLKNYSAAIKQMGQLKNSFDKKAEKVKEDLQGKIDKLLSADAKRTELESKVAQIDPLKVKVSDANTNGATNLNDNIFNDAETKDNAISKAQALMASKIEPEDIAVEMNKLMKARAEGQKTSLDIRVIFLEFYSVYVDAIKEFNEIKGK